MATRKNDTRVTISEEVILPSRGIGYPEEYNIPESFTLRAMTTLEEKLRLSSSDGFKIIPELINRCLVDANFDAFNLTLSDLEYTMIRLRTITYGQNYKIPVMCPRCGHTYETTVDLDTIQIKELPDGFSGTVEIGPLPISGDVLECKLLTSDEQNKIKKECKRLLSKNPGYVGDPEMIVKWNYIIKSKNEEQFDMANIQRYIENLYAGDFRYLESKYNKFTNSVGIDSKLFDTCPQCKSDFEFNLPIVDEFFRPEY